MKEDSLINSKDVDLAAIMVDGVAAVLLLPPVASFAITAVRSITELNEEQFKDKLKLFLQEADCPKEDKDKFLKLLDKDVDEFFKRLFKVLDRIEDNEKAIIIGRLFKAVINNKITVTEFKKLCTIIVNTYIGTLEYLKHFRDSLHKAFIKAKGRSLTDAFTKTDSNIVEQKQLVAAGFLYEEVKITSQAQHGQNKVDQDIEFLITDLGRKLLFNGLIPQDKN